MFNALKVDIICADMDYVAQFTVYSDSYLKKEFWLPAINWF